MSHPSLAGRELVCGYAPTTVNLHDVIFVQQDGRVVDVWTVFPRGSGHHGFLASLARWTHEQKTHWHSGPATNCCYASRGFITRTN